MNLQQINSGVIQAVNQYVAATIQVSTGYAVGADGTPVPTYAPAVAIQVQVQPLQYDDLKQMDGLNIAGIRRKIYLNGDWEGLVRDQSKGGDLVSLPGDLEGTVWLVVFVFEHWPDWTAACITLQNGV